MLSMIIGAVGAIVGLVGWFAYHSLTALIIGTVLYGVETIMEWQNLNAGAKQTDIFIFIIGVVVSFFIKTPWYICGMLALNIYNAVLSIPSFIKMLIFLFKK